MFLGMCVYAKSILFDPMACSPPGSSDRGTLQARILEWVAMPSSRGSSPPRDRTHVFSISCIGRWNSLPLAPPGKPPKCDSHSHFIGLVEVTWINVYSYTNIPSVFYLIWLDYGGMKKWVTMWWTPEQYSLGSNLCSAFHCFFNVW